MRKLALDFTALVLSGALFANSTTTPKITDLFSSALTLGKGNLTLARGGKSEKIALGEATGHYGMGVVFKAAYLPENFQKDFKGREVIQLAFGTTKEKAEGRISQFAATTLVTKGLPTKKKVFQFVVPNGKENLSKDLALMLFSAPSTPSEQSDEERLKGTLFAQEGSIEVVPKGAPSSVLINGEGTTPLTFKRQEMTLKFNAALVTPFSPEEGKLSGEISVPVFWPVGPKAEAFTKEIAAQSMGPLGRDLASKK